ncbi:MAG: HD domain-containing protein [Bacteroidales bacterium]|nr:HD domain-containing protein [Bacteroidales bacterium]
MDYEGVKTFMIGMLSRELKPDLFYHDLNHTLDVLHSAERLMAAENINPYDQALVKTACLFHDSGMLKTYVGHEEASCALAAGLLPGYGYNQNEIEIISNMIMTTKLPQSATKKLEQIICDADLDYLGRSDFFMISHRLKHEWDIHQFKITSLKQWYQLQVSFLKNHHYFTKSAITTRESLKQQNLLEILELLNGSA